MAILRALPGLGDFLCAVPVLRSVRSAQPAARIVLIGLPVNRPLVERFPAYVDELVALPGFPGLPDQPPDAGAVPRFLEAMQERRFDLVLQLHGNGLVSNSLAVLLGARLTAGFHLSGQWCPDRARFLPYLWDEPEPVRPLRLLDHLGIPSGDPCLEFPVSPRDREELEALLAASGMSGADDYACLHPGSAVAAKRWPPERFAMVGRVLAGHGLRVVVTGVPEEGELTRSVAAEIGPSAVDMGGRCSVGVLAALLSRSQLLVCNDTGVSHLAAALERPSVVVVTGPVSDRWLPLDRRRHRVALASSPLGRPRPTGHCLQDGCQQNEVPREDGLPAVETVVTEAEQLLSSELSSQQRWDNAH